MSRSTLVRILEAFFKRWFLYVLPLVAMIVLGLSAITSTRDQYTSSGSVFVESGGLIEALSDVPDGGFGSFLTPAQFASQELNGLLQTDMFVQSVLEAAGVGEDSTRLFWVDQVAETRAALGSRATSENLVNVTATTPDPELSRRLTAGAVEEFIDFKIDLRIAESAASEAFYSELAEEYRRGLDAARDAVDAFILEEGVIDVDLLTAEQTATYDRLNEAETSADATYRAALADVEASRLASLQAETEVRQGLSLVDPPQAPLISDNSLVDTLLTLATYLIIGIVLTVAGPVIAAMANRGVLFADDLAHLTTTSVIATVPRESRGDMKTGRAVAPEWTSAPPPTLATPGDLAPSTPDELDAMPPAVRPPAASMIEPPAAPTPPTPLNRIVPSTLHPRPDDAPLPREESIDPRSANG